MTHLEKGGRALNYKPNNIRNASRTCVRDGEGMEAGRGRLANALSAVWVSIVAQ